MSENPPRSPEGPMANDNNEEELPESAFATVEVPPETESESSRKVEVQERLNEHGLPRPLTPEEVTQKHRDAVPTRPEEVAKHGHHPSRIAKVGGGIFAFFLTLGKDLWKSVRHTWPTFMGEGGGSAPKSGGGGGHH